MTPEEPEEPAASDLHELKAYQKIKSSNSQPVLSSVFWQVKQKKL